ncbi:MAG: sensor domain-containing protein, partial [Alphaproteobacteria bacterium]|nr:sensor domain-containing protein [Alphaproteobacteria bacterium]
MIADALTDCEEHLNNEIAQNPDQSEASVLASVVETYGSPQEIAEEYRDMEATISTPFPKQEEPTQRQLGFFNVISDPRTYGALLYMLLSLITGIFYFTWTITGISLTAGFALLILGIPFALLFIGSIRLLSHVEGRIVESLLGVRMPRRLPPTTVPDESILTQIKEALIDMRTWTSMFYLLLMLPLGVAYFVVAVVGLSVSIGVAGGAIYSLVSNQSHIQIDSVPWLDHL